MKCVNNKVRNVSHPVFGNCTDITAHKARGISSSTELLPVPKTRRSKIGFVTILSPAGNIVVFSVYDEQRAFNLK